MNLGAPELMIVLVVILVLFGGAKLPKLARSLGEAKRELELGTREGASSTEKLAAEKLAAEKLAAEKLAAENLAAERLVAEKLAAEKLAADRLVAEKQTADNADMTPR